MFKFAIVLATSILLCEAAILKDSCSTPGVKNGVCVKLLQCPSISTMSNDFETPMTIDRLNYLIGSQCGYADRVPYVCCPIEEVVLKIEETTTLTELTTASLQNRDEANSIGVTDSNQNVGELTTSRQNDDEVNSIGLTNSNQNEEELTTSSQNNGQITTTSTQIREETTTTSNEIR